jgi:hypothetical protein
VFAGAVFANTKIAMLKKHAPRAHPPMPAIVMAGFLDFS